MFSNLFYLIKYILLKNIVYKNYYLNLLEISFRSKLEYKPFTTYEKINLINNNMAFKYVNNYFNSENKIYIKKITILLYLFFAKYIFTPEKMPKTKFLTDLKNNILFLEFIKIMNPGIL